MINNSTSRPRVSLVCSLIFALTLSIPAGAPVQSNHEITILGYSPDSSAAAFLSAIAAAAASSSSASTSASSSSSASSTSSASSSASSVAAGADAVSLFAR